MDAHPNPPLPEGVPADLVNAAVTAQLVEAARRVRPAALRPARRDAVALLTAATHGMAPERDQVIATWLGPSQRPDARTWVLAEEVLLTGAMLAAGRHLSAGLRPTDFPTLRVPPSSGPRATLQDLCAGLVTARVRGDAPRIDATFTTYLAESVPPERAAEFLRALVEVAAACAHAEARTSGQSVQAVLAKAGLAAAG